MIEGERKKIGSYRDLEVWKKGVRFTIAEGYGRESTKNYIQFLRTARGSMNEVETFLYIAYGLNYINKDCLDTLTQKSAELGKMLTSLIKKLNP